MAHPSRKVIATLVTLALAVTLVPAPAGAIAQNAPLLPRALTVAGLGPTAAVGDPVAVGRGVECGSVGSTPALPCEAWTARYCSSTCAGDAAYLIAVSPDSTRIYTGGSAIDGSTYSFLVVAYSDHGTRLWTQKYRGDGYRYTLATAMTLSPDGTKLFVTGYVNTALCCFDGDYGTVAYDAATGRELWVARYGGVGTSEPLGIAASPDGTRVYVTGGSNLNTDSRSDFATIAYDSLTGAEVWVARLNGQTGNPFEPDAYDQATAIGVSPRGDKVFVTGGTYGIGTEEDIVTIAYDAANGSSSWTTRFDGHRPGGAASQDGPNSLAVSHDGDRVVIGGTTSGGGNPDFLVVGYEASSGTPLWEATYGATGPGADDDILTALDISPDGSRVFATGPSWNWGSYSYATVAFDAVTGARSWVVRYDGPTGGDSRSSGLRVSPDSRHVHVTGYSAGLAGSDSYDIATISYDAATGDPAHVRRYDGPVKGRDYAFALETSPDDKRVYSVGLSAGLNGFFYTTLAYDT